MTHVKICGITNVQDAICAVEAGADLLGYVFYPPSQRAVTPACVAPISSAVRQACPSVIQVGVFVDEEPELIARIADACGLNSIQLHGEESPDVVDTLRERGLSVIKGLRVEGPSAIERMRAFRPSYFLLDSYVPGQPGGTGHAFDWQLARQAAGRTPVILAGGLSPESVGEAVRIARPWGVDVSTGVERAPGRKDPRKVQRFVQAAKSAETEDGTV
jgi:phosphoribosylanthranilate isomerase